jgi:hypothetical protein
MDQNTEKAFDEIEKALRPEVSKEQLGMVIEHLMEAIESMIEVPEEEDSEEETTAPEAEIEDMSKSEDYESDNEEEDKWNNMEKACWSGYTQRGMKEKNGRMVPNCVPIEKAQDLSEADQVKKSIFSGTFLK